MLRKSWKKLKLIKENQAKQGNSNSSTNADKSFFEKNKWLIIGEGVGFLVLIGLTFWVVKLKKAKDN